MGINVLSLFDGMSCGQLALQRAGIPVDNYFASEIDKYAIQITKKNFPNTIHLGDVTKVNGKDLPEIDLLIGGSPCQGFSVGGKGLNFDDPRSKLFFEFIRLRDEVRPKKLLLENVPMLKQWENVITEYVGFPCTKIDSADFSAQTRKRLYWTNIQIGWYTPSKATVEDVLEPEVDLKYVIDPKRAIKIVDNAVDGRLVVYIGTNAQSSRIYSIHGKSVTLSALNGGLGAQTGLYALPLLTPDRITKRQNGCRFKPPSAKFYTLTAMDRHGVLTNHFIRKLTPVECERLQTVPDAYTEGVSDTQRYKMLGNGWTVDVIAHIFKNLKINK